MGRATAWSDSARASSWMTARSQTQRSPFPHPTLTPASQSHPKHQNTPCQRHPIRSAASSPRSNVLLSPSAQTVRQSLSPRGSNVRQMPHYLRPRTQSVQPRQQLRIPRTAVHSSLSVGTMLKAPPPWIPALATHSQPRLQRCCTRRAARTKAPTACSTCQAQMSTPCTIAVAALSQQDAISEEQRLLQLEYLHTSFMFNTCSSPTAQCHPAFSIPS